MTRQYVLTDEDCNDIVDALDVVIRDLTDRATYASPTTSGRFVAGLIEEATVQKRLRLRLRSYAERPDRSEQHERAVIPA